MATCRQCKQDFPPYYIGTSGICYDCHLGRLLPRNYKFREQYTTSTATDIETATAKPPTGKAVLDCTPERISEVGGRAVVLPSGRSTGLSLRDFLLYGLTQRNTSE